MWGGSNAQRWHDLQSRRDAARILQGARRGPSGDGDDPDGSPRWYRNPWVWVVIVMVLAMVGWFIAAFA